MKKQIPNNFQPYVKSVLETEELAHLEAENFSDESLQRQRVRNNHKRSEGIKTFQQRATISLCYCVHILLCIGIVILAYHWMIPKCFHFLSTDQLDSLKTVGFTSLATTVLRGVFSSVSSR